MNSILNKTRLEALKVRLIAAAASQGKEIRVETVEDAVMNLEYLLQPKTVNGERRVFLPLQIKEEVFHLICPEGRCDTSVVYDEKEEMACAKTKVYASYGHETQIGEGFADQKVSTVPIFDSKDKAVQAVRRIAKGRAKSDALRDAGVASWFPDEFELAEAIDRADEDVPAPEAVDKTKEVKEVLEAAAPKTKKEETAVTEAEVAADGFTDIPEGEEVPFEDTRPPKKRKPAVGIDPKVLSIKIQGGAYDGKTLVDVEKENPSYLVKLVHFANSGRWNDADPALLDGIRALIKSDASKRTKYADALEKCGLTYETV